MGTSIGEGLQHPNPRAQGSLVVQMPFDRTCSGDMAKARRDGLAGIDRAPHSGARDDSPQPPQRVSLPTMPVTPGELLVNQPGAVRQQLDAVVVGAGFSGLYLLHRLRQLGFSVKVFDSASDVGGTWYWNRYPGARCDIPTTDYTYSFDPELDKEWTWSEKYATQPEILDYLRFVADRYGLRSDIEFCTSVSSARWDEGEKRWRLTTDRGQQLRCRYYIMASGCLSMPKSPEIEGADRFAAQVSFTSRVPHDGAASTATRTAGTGPRCAP